MKIIKKLQFACAGGAITLSIMMFSIGHYWLGTVNLAIFMVNIALAELTPELTP